MAGSSGALQRLRCPYRAAAAPPRRGEMTSSSQTSVFTPDLQSGKPPMLRVEAPMGGGGGDAARWAAEHRAALRAVVAEHGSLLVRGLGLCDVAAIEAVFRQVGSLIP